MSRRGSPCEVASLGERESSTIDKRKAGDKEEAGEKGDKKMQAKKARITAMEKELRALKAEVEQEDEGTPRRSRSKGRRAKKPHKVGEGAKEKDPFKVGGLREARQSING